MTKYSNSNLSIFAFINRKIKLLSAIKYKNVRFRVVISFAASFYILLHGHNLNVIWRAFSTPSFYAALAISFPITLFLVFLVHKVTVWLDKRHDWREHLFERILWQFTFAVLVPTLIDLGLISIYSVIIGENFIQSRFLLVDFPIIVAFIILLNMYYVIRYLLLTEPPKKESNERLVINYNGTYAELNPENEIICFHRKINNIRVITVGRVYETRGDSINEFERKFLERGFKRINRSTIVNLKFVQGYCPGTKKGTINVLFLSTVDTSGFDAEIFPLTEKYMNDFKDQFNLDSV